MKQINEPSNFSIRRVSTMEEARKIHKLMIGIWEMNAAEALPTFEIRAISDVGLVLMAYENSCPEEPIGYIYAVKNFTSKHFKHYSHMMGIKKDWQSKGVGYQLKKTHRKIALSSDPKVYSIEWTVDPLFASNAALNFGKLGCVCNIYKENYYGTSEEIGIYSNTETDRILVSWVLESEEVRKKLETKKRKPTQLTEFLKENAQIIVNRIGGNLRFVPLKSSNEKINERKLFFVEIPINFHQITENDLDIAKNWRQEFREICQKSFKNNWEICDFIRCVSERKTLHNFYKFIKKEPV